MEKRLILNVVKSSVMIHARNKINLPLSMPLPVVSTMKILGMVFDNNFAWDSHIDEVCKKANQRFHFLRQLRPLVTPSELHQIYTASIRSLLEYACPVFVGLNSKLSKRLQRIDRRAHGIICEGYMKGICDCNKETITRRRMNVSVKLFKEAENRHQYMLSGIIPRIHMFSGHYMMTYCRTEKLAKSFILSVIEHLNLKNSIDGEL